MNSELLQKVIFWVLIVGGLNWGIVGLVGFDVIGYSAALIRLPILARLVYLLVGIAAIIAILEGLNYTCPFKKRKK